MTTQPTHSIILVLLAATREEGERYLQGRGASVDEISTVKIVSDYHEAVRLAGVPEVDMKYVADPDDPARPLVSQRLVDAYLVWSFKHPRGPYRLSEGGTPVPILEDYPT